MRALESFPIQELSQRLKTWYQKNKRDLPWRTVKPNPYHILVSEVMLQQTRVEMALPYYHRFLNRFKTLRSLATSSEGEVFSMWTGLGYYTRAKNLRLASQILLKNFPRSYKELQKLPGLGPYTARAVSSFAFEEKVGTIEANTIRVLCRFCGFSGKWWGSTGKKNLQNFWDQWIKSVSQKSSIMNQALMELGSRVCKSQSPRCGICPLKDFCYVVKNNKREIDDIPLKKSKRKKQIWYWEPHLILQKKKLAFIENHRLPFLRGKLVPPGLAYLKKRPPKTFCFVHYIMHFVIYVKPIVLTKCNTLKNEESFLWISQNSVSKKNPSTLIKKIMDQGSFV